MEVITSYLNKGFHKSIFKKKKTGNTKITNKTCDFLECGEISAWKEQGWKRVRVSNTSPGGQNWDQKTSKPVQWIALENVREDMLFGL